MSDIKKLLSKSEEAGKPTEGERGLLINSLSLLSKKLESELRDCDSIIVDIAIQELESLQAENAELKEQGEWISVVDELPEFNTVVLVKVYRERGISWPEADYSCTAKLSRVTRHCGENSPIDNRWYVFPSGGTEITRDVTHWMPLPTPPKGE